MQQGSGENNENKTGVETIRAYDCKLKAVIMNVDFYFKLLSLQARKEVTYNEAILLQLLVASTIGGHNKGKQDKVICRLVLEDLAEAAHQTLNKIQAQLKSLESKGLIVRGENRTIRRDGVILYHEQEMGLTESFFGQILTDRQIEKKGLRLVVDKSDSGVDKSKNPVPVQYHISTKVVPLHYRFGISLVPIRYWNCSEVFDNKGKNLLSCLFPCSFPCISLVPSKNTDNKLSFLDREQKERERLEAEEAKKKYFSTYGSMFKKMPKVTA